VTPQETLIVDLVRLGLKGDSPSVRRLATKLLRASPAPSGDDAPFRDAIAKLVLDQSSASHLTREAPRESIPIDANSFMSLTRIDYPSDVTPALLASETDGLIRQVIDERKNPGALASVGLEPTRTLLLTGPPGVGKTMTARFLAASLEVPMVTIDLSTLISSYLGRTGNNLRQVLDYAKSTACVFLMDEFDALGKRRDDPSDVGELKRIVNVLLLELDQWPSKSLLVAATNHPELLDRAVWRRFERVINIPMPNSNVRHALTVRILASHGMRVDEKQVEVFVLATDDASGSEIETIVRGSVRNVAMGTHLNIHDELLKGALDRLRKIMHENKAARMEYCGISNEILHVAQRDIAAELGVTHPIVGRLVEAWRRKHGRPRKNGHPNKNGHVPVA